MCRTAILLFLSVGFTFGQLNFEGNPLTEDTEYTAEESKYSQRSIQDENAIPQKLFPVYEKIENALQTTETSAKDQNKVKTTKLKGTNSTNLENVATSAREIQTTPYTQQIQQTVINPAEVALSTFLNSRTPEESRLSLDTYLRNSQMRSTASPKVSGVVAQENQQRHVNIDQTQTIGSATMPRHHVATDQHPRTPDQHQNQPVLQTMSQVDQPQQGQIYQSAQVDQHQRLIQTAQGYGYANPIGTGSMNSQHVQPTSTVPGTPVIIPGQQILQPSPFVPASIVPIQPRNDVMAHPAWRYRMRGVRARPYPFAQPRLGPGVYKAPLAVPFKQKEPVEIIYTRPPGFHRGPPRISNPPVAYEDASAFFPESDRPPPAKDVYYSQLYAQSYDPHYYNYIAKTGKIRPHLYGKLGKYHEEKDDGIWSELYRGFTKHGLKNIMTPSFLLGMTIPAAITLMLSMLVQKRSLSRSDSRSVQQDLLQEYTERMQRAIECYEKKRRKNGNSTKDVDCYN